MFFKDHFCSLLFDSTQLVGKCFVKMDLWDSNWQSLDSEVTPTTIALQYVLLVRALDSMLG